MKSKDVLLNAELNTASYRETIKETVLQQIDYLKENPDLTAKERIEFVTRLLPYSLPKLSAIEQEGQEYKPHPLDDI